MYLVSVCIGYRRHQELPEGQWLTLRLMPQSEAG